MTGRAITGRVCGVMRKEIDSSKEPVSFILRLAMDLAW
jgi:hypothetical protein